MRKNDPWTMLRTGAVKAGLQKMERDYVRDPDASHTMELGVAYLWVRRYEKAEKHFANAIHADPRPVSSYYGMAGTAEWCMDRQEQAVQYWRSGLAAPYADAAGLGIRLPLLLMVASVLEPSVCERRVVEELLCKKVKDSRISVWPGPIALWLLAEITDDELQVYSRGRDESETLDQSWEADLYRAIRLRAAGESRRAKTLLKHLVDTSHPEWENETFFLARMWTEEFFIARHEVGRIQG